jgi:hypothetical protein
VVGAESAAAAARGLLENLGSTGGAWRAAYFHAPIVAALCAAIAVLAVLGWSRVRPAADAPGPPPPLGAEGLALVGLAGIALALLQAGALPEVHAFYAVPAMPFVSLAAAFGPVALAARAARGGRGAAIASAGLVAVAAHPILARTALPRAFPDEAREAGAAVRYAWPDPEVPAPLARASRAVAWSGSRERGRAEPPWRHAVWSKAAAFSSAPAIAAHVRARTTADETITGASTAAPLVALLAGRRMAAGEVDTNAKRFAAGSLDEEDFLERALADRAAFVIASPRSFFTQRRLETDPRWSGVFVLDRVFLDEGLGRGEPVTVAVYRRRR